jgi:hypothetical protein
VPATDDQMLNDARLRAVPQCPTDIWSDTVMVAWYQPEAGGTRPDDREPAVTAVAQPERQIRPERRRTSG